MSGALGNNDQLAGRHRYPGGHYLLTFASLVVAIAGLRLAAALLVPVLLAGFIAVLSVPLLLWLQKWVPKPLAIALTVFAEVAVLSGALFLVVGSVQEFTQQLPRYQESVEEASVSAVTWLQERGVAIEVTDLFDPGRVFSLASGAFVRAAGVLQNTVLVILITVFILMEVAYLPAKVRMAVGSEERMQRIMAVMSEIQRYLGLKTVISLVTGALVTLWLSIMGIDFPVVWGLAAFFFNFVPNIGSIAAAAPTVFIAAIQFGPGKAAAVLAGYVVINVALGNLIEPHLMGRRFGLSTLVVFLSLVFWGWIWGPVGMLLSVPLTIILKILLENTRDFRWLAVMLGPGPHAPSG